MTKSSSSSTPTPAPKRRRGRPRKFATATPTFDVEREANAIAAAAPDINDLDKIAQEITAMLRRTIDKAATKQKVIVEPLLVTTKQAAEALAVSEGTIFNLISDGRLNAIKIAGTRRVPLDEIRRLAAVGTN